MPKDKLTKAQRRAHRDEEQALKRAEKKSKQMSGSGLKSVPRTVMPENSTRAPPSMPPTTTTPTTTTQEEPPPRNSSPETGSPPPRSSSPRTSPAPDATPLADHTRKPNNRSETLDKIIQSMQSNVDLRETSDDLEDYHDQARMVPWLVHPFMDVYEVLMFGHAYKGTDMTWDEDDEDNEDDVESEDESEDEDEQEQRTRDRKEARAADRDHKKELLYEYNALLKLIPDLKKDIELLDDDDIKSLSNYIKYESGKARSSDSSHLVDRLIQYIPLAHGDMDDTPYPTRVEKGRRGYKEYVTAREFIPPSLIDSFNDDWQKLCESILSDKVIITAAGYPLFLFDLDLSWWNDDSNILDGLLRGVLLLLAVKSLWTGPLSATLVGGRKLKTPGKQPIAVANNVTKITPRMLAYTAVQVRHALTSGSWNVMDHHFDNSNFFDRIVALFKEPMSAWARELLEWWNAQVFGNMSNKQIKKLTHGRNTMDDLVQQALKDRSSGKTKAAKAAGAAKRSASPARSPSAPPRKKTTLREDSAMDSLDADGALRDEERSGDDKVDDSILQPKDGDPAPEGVLEILNTERDSS